LLRYVERGAERRARFYRWNESQSREKGKERGRKGKTHLW
jgi:hypothetical protein